MAAWDSTGAQLHPPSPPPPGGAAWASLRATVQAEFVSHVRSLVALQQAGDGRWHQVLDAPATFLETSAIPVRCFRCFCSMW